MDGYGPSPLEPPGDDLTQAAPSPPFSEYWVWQGDALVAATFEDVARIREWERERAARWRLRQWEREGEVRRWPGSRRARPDLPARGWCSPASAPPRGIRGNRSPRRESRGRKEPISMSRLRVLNHMGDRQILWDPSAVAAGDPEAQVAVATAEHIFAEHRTRGATAVRVRPDRAPERIEQFDPAADQIVLIPRMVGG